MSEMRKILPHRGRGTTRSVVEGQVQLLRMVNVVSSRGCPSTILRMVPLPVPGRIS
jgi:hypothetical protein